MGGMMFAGCLLIAYGPPAVLLLTYASRRSALLILTIASAFFWLLSIFLTSVVWIAIPPLKTVHPFTITVGIIIQELLRYALVWTYVKSEKAADKLVRRGGPKIFNDLSAGIAAGLGFGLMHTIMMYGALIGAATGEAAFYIDSCPGISMFIWTAVVALLYNVLHVTLMVIAVDAYRRWSPLWAAIPVVVHLVFGLMTLLNTSQNGCSISLPIMAAIVAGTMVLVAVIERSPDYSAKRQQRAWELLTGQRIRASVGGPSGAVSSSSTPLVAPATNVIAVASTGGGGDGGGSAGVAGGGGDTPAAVANALRGVAGGTPVNSSASGSVASGVAWSGGTTGAGSAAGAARHRGAQGAS